MLTRLSVSGLRSLTSLDWAPRERLPEALLPRGGQNADGDYEFVSHAFLITAGWRF